MGIQLNEYHSENSNEYLGRIRSKRQRQRAKIEDKDKQLIKFYKEQKKLSKQKHELPMVDLIPPVQKGHKRYFVLREDVRRSKDGVFYENLLEKINTYQYSPEKVFRTKKRKAGKRYYVETMQELRRIYPHELPKLKLTEREIACFEYRNFPTMQGRKIYDNYAYVFIESWRYVLRVRPNIVYKIKVLDTELEQRIDKLSDFIYENHKNYGRIKKLRGWKKNRYENDLKYKNPIKNVPLNQLLEEDIY